jgi:thioredoxin reductase (NADPH)
VTKPSILAVDDEPAVLSAVERDLRRQYGRDYRILKATSGEAALDTLRQMKERNDPLALLIVDQRMPQMEGTVFLAEAMRLYPDVRKVLLTAYADTQAAIDSINRIGLDHYLMKPWDPPDTNLYPVLDDLLDEWQATVPQPYQGIRVVGTRWSPHTHQVKSFLALNRVPYQYLDIERDAEAAALVEADAAAGVIDGARLPIIYFPDGTVLVAPDARLVAEKAGVRKAAAHPYYDVIILGAGPAGLGAAVYAASEGLQTAVIEREAAGGQAGTSSRIENYLGFPKGLSGAELARRATTQAIRFGAEILTAHEAVSARVEENYRIVRLSDDSELTCKALIVATGVTAKRLALPDVDRLTGAGIYYGAALNEAATYRGEHVLVVGGANSAGQGAMFFARFAAQVTMVVRASDLERGMSQYLVDQIRAMPNISVRVRSELAAVRGGRHLEEVDILDGQTGAIETISCPAIFLFIGAMPHSEPVASLVERNSAGFILTGADLLREGKRPRGWTLTRDPYLLETNVPGIFAAGDVRQGAVRRVASAVGEGAVAVGLVHQYLQAV